MRRWQRTVPAARPRRSSSINPLRAPLDRSDDRAPDRLLELLRRVPAQGPLPETSLPTIRRPTTWGLTSAAVVSTGSSGMTGGA